MRPGQAPSEKTDRSRPISAKQEEDLLPEERIPRARMDSTLLSVNNGPLPYRDDMGQGTVLTGGTSPSADAQFADAQVVSSLYRSMGVRGIRPNDLGGPLDLRCMFPISSTSEVPDPNSTYEEIRDDPRWNWAASDAVFASMLEGGFAPYLKIASREWISGAQQGFSYVGEGGTPVYVVEQQNLEGFCSNWPYISPIIESVGDKLALAIVERYNNATMWKESLIKGGIIPPGAPLESATWSGVTNATVGVELQNEYNGLQCLKTGSGDTSTLEGWRQNCGGDPYTYGWKYWDGSPEGARRSFVSQVRGASPRFLLRFPLRSPCSLTLFAHLTRRPPQSSVGSLASWSAGRRPAQGPVLGFRLPPPGLPWIGSATS